MARELEGYRDVMEDLLTFFNGRRLLYQRDVAEYLGCCPRKAAKLYNIPREGITIPLLARRICKQ